MLTEIGLASTEANLPVTLMVRWWYREPGFDAIPVWRTHSAINSYMHKWLCSTIRSNGTLKEKLIRN